MFSHRLAWRPALAALALPSVAHADGLDGAWICAAPVFLLWAVLAAVAVSVARGMVRAGRRSGTIASLVVLWAIVCPTTVLTVLPALRGGAIDGETVLLWGLAPLGVAGAPTAWILRAR